MKYLLFTLALLWPAAAWANPNPMTRAEIITIAKTVPGFSYWWGGGGWLPGASDKGKCTPTGGSGCPNCTHSGAYGADCSGFVAKAWQIDKPTPLQQNYHPYSTASFDGSSTWWNKLPKDQAKQADAFNYNKNGSGHVFLYDKGDPWGSVYAWECKGCAYGCVYNLRSVSADYSLIRRKLLTEAQTCTKHCEGTVIVDEQCGKGDCAAYAAGCVSDNLGVRCVSAFCPAQGKVSTCLPDPKNGKISTCNNGALGDVGDCSVYGAFCSTAVAPPACVSGLCASGPTAKPQSGDLCYLNKRYTCNSAGGVSESPCPANAPCQTAPGKTGPGSGSCGSVPCGNCDDSNPCTTDSCSNGVCEHAPNAAKCDDANACTSADLCVAGLCVGVMKSCDDGYDCTEDGCNAGTCTHKPSGSCDDGNPCTNDVCSTNGCSHKVLNSGPCEDGDGCTVGGGCKNGECLPGTAKICDDGSSCTIDVCKDGSCIYSPVADNGPCEDGDPTTFGDYCAKGQCLAGGPNCDDGNSCTADVWVDGACAHTPICTGDAETHGNSDTSTAGGDVGAGGSDGGLIADARGKGAAAGGGGASAAASSCTTTPSGRFNGLILLLIPLALSLRKRKLD